MTVIDHVTLILELTRLCDAQNFAWLYFESERSLKDKSRVASELELEI